MKANELRIGNYVQSLDDNNVPSLGMELMEIVGIKHNGEGYYNPKHEIGKRYKDLEQHGWFSEDCELLGVPLTEEILLKCGFVKDGDNYMKLILEEYCNLFFDLKHKTIAIGVPHEAGGTEFSYEALHQLQNLYFALTGEELTINI